MTHEPTSPHETPKDTDTEKDPDATVEMSAVSKPTPPTGWSRKKPSGAATASTAVASAQSSQETSASPPPETPGSDSSENSYSRPSDASGNVSDGATIGPRPWQAGWWNRRRAVIVAGSVAGALLVAYLVAFAAYGSQLANGTTVAGVDVGGLSKGDAEAKLEQELPKLLKKPIVVTTEGADSTYEVVPRDAGLGIDVAASIDAAPGGSASPISLLNAIGGGSAVQPVTDVDDEALNAALTSIAEDADVDPVNGGVAFDEGKVVTSEPAPGSAVNIEESEQVVKDAFFGGDVMAFPLGDVTLPTKTVSPEITQAEVDRAVAEFAEPAMSGPVTVVADDKSVDLDAGLIGQALVMEPKGGQLEPKLAGKKLSELAHDDLGEVGQEGRDATIVIENDQPVVVGEELGLGIAPKDLRNGVMAALTKSGDARVADVELTEIDPELTTNTAEELGVERVIEEFTTTFPYAEYRNTNIGLAAEKIDNTLLKPGDTFSLNGLVGERTAANGFASGGIISGGTVVEDYGGGVSQVATTTYHTAFKAGLEDVEHKPHSIWFSRYPVAEEATVSWGNFDMAFKNDTPFGIVVDTVFTSSTPGSQGVLTVKLWSTPHFEVETSLSEKSNFTGPGPIIYNTADNCIANSASSQGFDITSYRKVWKPSGKLVKDESYPWTYNPNPEVVCGEPPKGDDKEE